MTASSWLARPRLLAGMTLAFALVPVWLAWVTWRDARNKDERLFETSAQLLAEKLQRGLERNDYFLGALRERAQNLDDTALLDGRLAPPAFDLQRRLPHLLAFGFAAPETARSSYSGGALGARPFPPSATFCRPRKRTWRMEDASSCWSPRGEAAQSIRREVPSWAGWSSNPSAATIPSR